jgi:hypothetical protein
MPFDNDKWRARASQGDVGSIAITLALTLARIAQALEALRDGDKDELAERIKEIRGDAEYLDGVFKDLTGYTKE